MPMGDDDYDEMMIFPITDMDEREAANDGDTDDSDDSISGRYAKPNKKNAFKPVMSLRQRRRSKLGYDSQSQFGKLNLNEVKHTRSISECSEPENLTPGKTIWLRALKKIRKLVDPWAKFNIDNLAVERCVRHRYNALKQKWVEDDVQVKMEKEPFNHGAMRACYRLKKLSSFSHRRDWKHAHNYVAKIYMENVEKDVYFEDVRLQMDAKLWGEEYNRHKPPKKVDIFQMSILEFVDRPGQPLYHLEHFIEGDYIKYNSNSGFVDEHLRLTPQAFSHFTFERSGHQLIVVDIQGVGDLWTDPQIHTANGEGYGDGNLGTRGMALFFHTHVCNSICASLNLSKFDLSTKEVDSHNKFMQMQKSAKTVVRGQEEAVVCASPSEKTDLTTFLARSRSRTISTASSALSDLSEEDHLFSQSLPDDSMLLLRHQRSLDEPMSPGTPEPRIAPTDLHDRPGRVRFVSDSDESGASTLTEEEERTRFQQAAAEGHRPSCMTHEINLRNITNVQSIGDSVLGQIHHELAKYHEMGRFAENENVIDWEAALFHEQQAAQLGVMEAILTLAKLNLGMQPDVLVNCTVQQNEENFEEGVTYMLQAAIHGDRSAMLYMANAYETGNNLGKARTQSFKEAVRWYDRAVNAQQDDNGEYDAVMDTPLHAIKAKMASMYLEGDVGLEKDPSYAGDLYNEAAEEAMTAMKGRLANKYYALAEEAYALVEED